MRIELIGKNDWQTVLLAHQVMQPEHHPRTQCLERVNQHQNRRRQKIVEKLLTLRRLGMTTNLLRQVSQHTPIK